MKKIIKKIYMRILYNMPKNLAHKIYYKHKMHKKLNLDNPTDFNEKIQWLIVNKYNKKYGDLTDKYIVRNYITEKGFKDILPKLYGIYNNADEIDLEKLPNKFVLKPNNGCGKVFVCKDKEKFNINNAKLVLNKGLHENFALKNLEYHYSYINPKIICEELLEDGKLELPLDYKFYCYKGKVECILLCSNREKELKLDYYDTDWNYLNYAKKEFKSNEEHKKPKNLKQMIEIASKLSEEFEFVRVDLYNIDGKIYFGELTFSPACGLQYANTDEALNYLGSLIKIDLMKKE